MKCSLIPKNKKKVFLINSTKISKLLEVISKLNILTRKIIIKTDIKIRYKKNKKSRKTCYLLLTE